MTKLKEKTETLQLIPVELSPILKDTKIELSKAEGHAMAFAPSMGSYLELAEVIKGLDKVNPTEAMAKQAREARLKMVKVRTAAEEIKDLRKEGIKAEGDLIQSLYNVVKNSCLVTETEFTEIEKHQERMEANRQAELSATRIELLAVFGTDTTYLPLGVMTDEQFNRLLETETIAFNARKLAAEQAEAKRIEDERLAEEARLAQIEKDRLEREEKDRQLAELQKAETERLAKEAELIKEHQLLNKRFEQYALKAIMPYGFDKVDHGLQHREYQWFIGAKFYSEFTTEADMLEWVAEIKQRHTVFMQEADAKFQLEKQREENAKLAAEIKAKQDA